MTSRSFLVFFGSISFLTALFHWTVLHPDEHFQILEFLNYKFLGGPPGDLSWEFLQKMRPSLQIYFYELLRQLALIFHLRSPFSWALVFRLSVGLFAAYSFYSFCQAIVVKLIPKNSEEQKLFNLLMVVCLFFCGFLFSSSSEGLGTSLFLLGYSLWFSHETQAWPRKILVGFILGLAFQVKYLILLWMLPIIVFRAFKMPRWSPVHLWWILGFILASILGVALDSHFYGELTFAPLNYLRANLFENAAARFGTLTWWSYVPLLLQQTYGLFFILGLVASTFVWRKSELACSILFSFFVLSLEPHKELRFLFPTLPLIIGVFVEFYAEWVTKKERFRQAGRLILLCGLPVFTLNWIHDLGADSFSTIGIRAFLNYFEPQEHRIFGNLPDPFQQTGLRSHFYDSGDQQFISSIAFDQPGLWILKTGSESSAFESLLIPTERPCDCINSFATPTLVNHLFISGDSYKFYRCPPSPGAKQCPL